MTYKIAFFSSDWLSEIVNEKQRGIKQFLDEFDDCKIDVFENFGNYGLVHPMDSLLEIFKLADIKDYDALMFQGNSNFYKDQRQKIIAQAQSLKIPVISINYPIEDCIYVGTNNRQAIYDITNTVIKEKHCHSVAYVSGPMSSKEARLRKQGFIEATSHLQNVRIIDGNWNNEDGKKAGQLLIQDPPQLIVCANDNLAFGVSEIFKENGSTVGKDVYITGFDNITIAQVANPRLTTIARDYCTIIYHALKTAREVILGKVIKKVYSPYQIIKSASCGYPVSEKDNNQLKKEYLSYTHNSNCFFESAERLEIQFAKVNHLNQILDIFEKESQNFGYKNIYLVINSDYLDYMSQEVTQYSDKMYLMAMTYASSLPDECHIYETFHKKEVLPQKYQSRCMVYTSLSNNGVAIGYLGFDGFSKNISMNYMTTLLKLLGLTIEGVRKENVLSLLNQRLEDLYVKDSLTDLYNRFGMDRFGKKIYNDYLKKDGCVFIYFIDMDHMKEINDIHGHEMGDFALKEAAQLVKEVSQGDFAMRYGGDEFIIITSCQNTTLAHTFEEKLKVFNDSQHYPFELSLSVGCFQSTLDHTFEEAIKQADTMMYEIKKRKKAQRK